MLQCRMVSISIPTSQAQVCHNARERRLVTNVVSGIAMARMLYDGLVEYEDGTPATASQMAKDVVEFLNWSAEPEMDDRKRMGAKVLIISTLIFGLNVWVKRYKWTNIKTRKLVYDPPIQKPPPPMRRS